MPARLSAIFLAAALFAPRAAADEPTELSVHVGKMTLNMGKAAVGGATSSGSAYGVRYLHSTTPFLAWGVDADFLRPKDKTTDSLISNMRATTSVDSAALFGVARVGPTEEVLRPYFLLGLGIHFTSIRLEAQPKDGFAWVDTGTGERRKLIESGGRGAASTIGVVCGPVGTSWARRTPVLPLRLMKRRHSGSA